MSFFDVFPTFYESPYSYTLVPLIVVSSIIGFYRKDYFHALLLHPYEVWQGKRLHTLLTSAFVHRSWLHLLFNCIIIFGLVYDTYANLEQEYGITYAYVVTPILALMMILLPNLLQTLIECKNFLFTAVGASGLSSGLFGFSALFFPLDRINHLFLPWISNATHFWLYALVMLLLFTFIKYTRINRKLHLAAYIMGSLLALLLRKDAVIEFAKALGFTL